jgi:tripartite-type tricarboxylate transporter receptor subunit TctC
MAALLGGQVDFIIDPVAGSINLIRERKIRALATTGARRSPLLPDVAPVSDVIPDYDHQGWFGLYGPANLPPEIVESAHAEVVKFQKTESFVSSLTKMSYEIMSATPAELKARVQAEHKQWGEILKKPDRR